MSVYDIFSIKGKTALVTGAGRGIGRVLVQALAEAGCNVALLGLHKDNLDKAAAEIEKTGVRAITLEADVSQRNDVREAFSSIKNDFGRLDICVNNAGVSMQVPAEEMPEEDWNAIIDINMKGVFFCCQEAAKMMIQQNSGTIINIGSISGSAVNVPQKQGVYNTSKAGVVMLSKSLAVEWAKYGIRVNSISPGYIKTEMTLETMSDLFARWESLTPMGRLGEAEELRGALLYLPSDASSYLTGHDLIIDGGYTAR